MSLTEEEYEIAEELDLPRRIFVLDEGSSSLGASPRDLGLVGQADDDRRRQERFRSRLREQVVCLVQNPDDLATGIVGALADQTCGRLTDCSRRPPSRGARATTSFFGSPRSRT